MEEKDTNLEENSEQIKEATNAPKTETKSVSSGEGTPVLAPIQGNVIDIKVSVGKKVKKGDCLLIIEAMKLENEVLAPCDGEIGEIAVELKDGKTFPGLFMTYFGDPEKTKKVIKVI